MSDLRKRLNAAYENGMFNEDWDDLDGVCALLLEAESRLALLESVLAEAGEALKPFAKEAASWTAPECADEAEPHICINELFGLVPAEYTFGDLRRAASVSNQIAALKENGK